LTRILVDTHIFLWQFFDDPKLSRKMRDVIDDQKLQLLLSDVSIWEIAIKVRLGKLPFAMRDIEAEIKRCGYEPLRIERAHVVAVATLKHHHNDPFDHLLIAQAMVERTPVLTADAHFGAYPIQLALV
jgi:PIN domain nuclease of toxin-antitoxin system